MRRSRSRRRRKRKVSYNIKLIAISAGMLMYSLKLQSYGSTQVETKPEVQTFVASPKEYLEMDSLAAEIPSVGEEEYKSYAVPEGEFSEENQKYAEDVCEKYGVPYEIVFSIIHRESHYNSASIGDDGQSFGYMQIMKKWHVDRMERLGVKDLMDPKGNILVGIDYLSELLGSYPEMNLALMAYNCGPDGAERLWKQGIYQTDYSTEIMEEAESIRMGLPGGEK